MLAVSTDLDLTLVMAGEHCVQVPATLVYSSDNPYAVTTLFRTAEGEVAWVFGRDLLEDGLTDSVGEGDVAVWPAAEDGRAVVCLSLVSPSGSALLHADAGAVRRFLDQSFAAVPMGTESRHLDLDAELADLLGDDAPHH